MTPEDVIREHLPDVENFLEEVDRATDEEDRHLELRSISRTIRFLRDFYIEFMRERLEIHIHSFSYKDKRAVSRRLVRAEDQLAEAPDGVMQTIIELAARFEDLTDLLHGDLEFGYSGDDDDYKAFHQEAFPEWLEAVEAWLRAIGGKDPNTLADSIHSTWNRYWDVVSSTY